MFLAPGSSARIPGTQEYTEHQPARGEQQGHSNIPLVPSGTVPGHLHILVPVGQGTCESTCLHQWTGSTIMVILFNPKTQRWGISLPKTKTKMISPLRCETATLGCLQCQALPNYYCFVLTAAISTATPSDRTVLYAKGGTFHLS